MQENKKIEVSNDKLVNILNKYFESNVELIEFESKKFKGGTLGDLTEFTGSCNVSGNTKKFELILKVQNKFARFGDPDSWLREYMMYDTDLYNNLPNNLYVPRCIDKSMDNNQTWIWMEKLSGNHEQSLTVDDYGLIAKKMGEFGLVHLNKDIKESFYSSKYWFSRNVNIWSAGAILLLKDDNKYGLSDEVINKLLSVWNSNDELIDKFLSLSTTVCHRDLTPGNVFVKDEAVYVLDWDCTGLGIVGEDIADLFMEAVVYYDFDVDKIHELEEVLVNNYYLGLNKSVDLEEIKYVFNTQILLVWSYRILCLFEDNEEKIDRYKKILNHIINR